MRTILTLHPDQRCAAVSAIEVEAERPEPNLLSLRFIVTGDLGALVLPPAAPPVRTDELWRHSCFEAFVGVPDIAVYSEVNLAPSGQWAAYRFRGYREGMTPLEPFAPPGVEMTPTDGGFELSATLSLDGIARAPWRLGLSAVIEEAGGAICHWAVAHPPGRPDFHHRDGFALQLLRTARA